MWLQFFLENTHFALNVFAAFVFFAVGWLYFDAWLGRKTLREGLRVLGLFLLSVSFLIHAISIESILLQGSFYGEAGRDILEIGLIVARALGYILICLSLYIDPLQDKPHHNHGSQSAAALALGGLSLPILSTVEFIFPLLSSLVGLLYLKRATIGLENHLKPVGISFFILGGFELFHLFSNFKNSDNIDLYNLVASFGPMWIIEHLLLFIALFMLGRWVFGYLLKRLQSQLFMIFTSSILVIFLLTTVSFTALLLKNLEQETLKQLETDVKVLNYAVDAKKSQTLSDAQVLAQNPQLVSSLKEKNKAILYEISSSYLLTKGQSFVVITSETGQVLSRGEDKEKIGDSLSDDALIKRGILGQSVVSVVSKEGVLAPEISVRSVVPVKDESGVLGTVMTGSVIDNAFVDGVKSATGLEASIYSDNKLSATTLVTSDGKSRFIGIKEGNKAVSQKVLAKGESFSGQINLANLPYFGAYLPLKDLDKVSIGMLFVGKLQLGVLQTAGKSMELTFMVTVLLIILSFVPVYYIAKSLSDQVK